MKKKDFRDLLTSINQARKIHKNNLRKNKFMTVKELLEVIKRGQKDYKDFLDWEVALEHVPNYKKDVNCQGDIITHYDEITKDPWIFIKSHSMGCSTYFTEQKVFGIQIHY